MPKNLIIFGDRTANEVLEAAELACAGRFSEIRKVYFERERFEQQDAPAAEALGDVFFCIGVANIKVKDEVIQACIERGWRPLSVVHPSAVISPTAQIGSGCYVGPLAVVSSHAQIGEHCIVHIHASVGHDCKIADRCAILPGARLSGNVCVEEASLIGSNAFVAAGVSIGRDCQVDALTYVHRDLPDRHIISIRAKKPVKRID